MTSCSWLNAFYCLLDKTDGPAPVCLITLSFFLPKRVHHLAFIYSHLSARVSAAITICWFYNLFPGIRPKYMGCRTDDDLSFIAASKSIYFITSIFS